MNSSEIIECGKNKLLNTGVSDINVPGLGFAGNGVTYNRNRAELNKYSINTKLIGKNFQPDTSINFLGRKLKMPIMVAPMSGIKTNLKGVISEKDFLDAILLGSSNSGTIGWCGDSFDTTSDYIVPKLIKTHSGIGVCKPRSINEIKSRIEKLTKAGVYAIGIDVDGIGALLLSKNGSVSRKSKKDLIELRKFCKRPMFLKGILNISDARMAYECGYDGIVISNHGGRVLDYAPATANVLPNIAKEFRGKMDIIADGGINNGFDVFIYLALGADAVLVGRSILYACVCQKTKGVEVILNQLNNQLKKAMLFSGCNNINDISIESIFRNE